MLWAADCPYASEAEKKDFKGKVAAAKARYGPHSSTMIQKSSAGEGASSSTGSVNRLRHD